MKCYLFCLAPQQLWPKKVEECGPLCERWVPSVGSRWQPFRYRTGWIGGAWLLLHLIISLSGVIWIFMTGDSQMKLFQVRRKEQVNDKETKWEGRLSGADSGTWLCVSASQTNTVEMCTATLMASLHGSSTCSRAKLLRPWWSTAASSHNWTH